MSYLGFPSLSIPSIYLKSSLILLYRGYERLINKCIIKEDLKEDDITLKLYEEIRNEQNESNNRILKVEPFQSVVTPEDVDTTLGVIDIRFIWDLSYNSYLAVEAKRLFGIGPSLADKYVEKGIMDFVCGKYSKNHDHAIMLGYILKGPKSNAIESVNKALSKRVNKTKQISEFVIYDIDYLPNANIFNSKHQQSDNVISIIHMFLLFDESGCIPFFHFIELKKRILKCINQILDIPFSN